MAPIRIILISLLLSFSTPVSGQIMNSDSLEYVYYLDKVGNKKKAVAASPKQILIVAGDSIYTVLDDFQLRKMLENQKGFKILNHRDSINNFLRERIKGIIIIKKDN